MPAVSKKQQKFFGIVRAIQKGEQAPTTPETAKAAADMKKGDVKKFASTKHKGLPEKKKIVEDKQVKKIIKQLRKSVKSHKKQADTLEKKIKTFKESAFTNITVGNKVGQTFQHASGATITLDNTMSDPSDLPSQVRIDLGGGDFLTVPAPSTNEYGIAGITSSLGNAGGGGGVKTRQRTKTAAEINLQLDASQQASGAETAKVGEITDPLKFSNQIQAMDAAYTQRQAKIQALNDEKNKVYDRYKSQYDVLNNKIQKIVDRYTLDSFTVDENKLSNDPEYKAFLKQMQKLSDAEKAEMDRLDAETQIPYASDYQLPGTKEYKDMQRVSFDEYFKTLSDNDYNKTLMGDPGERWKLMHYWAEQGKSAMNTSRIIGLKDVPDPTTGKIYNIMNPTRTLEGEYNYIDTQLGEFVKEKLKDVGYVQYDHNKVTRGAANIYNDIQDDVLRKGPAALQVYIEELSGFEKYMSEVNNILEKDLKEYKSILRKKEYKTSSEIRQITYNQEKNLKYYQDRLNEVKNTKGNLSRVLPDIRRAFEGNFEPTPTPIKPPAGFDGDGDYIPPGFEDAIRTDQIGDTQLDKETLASIEKFADKDTLEKILNAPTMNTSLLQKTISFSNKSSLVNKLTDSTLRGPLSKYKAPVKLFLGYLTGTIPKNEAHTVLTKKDIEQAWSDLYIDPSSNALSVDGAMQNVIGGESLSNLRLDGNKAKLKFGFQPHVNRKEFAQHPNKYNILQKAAMNFLGPYSADLQVGPGFLRPIGGAIASRMTEISKVVDFLTPNDTILGNIKTGRNLKGEIKIDINKLKNGSWNQKQIYDYLINKEKGIKESKLSFELIQQFKEGSNPDRPKKLKEQTTFPQMQERIRNAKEKRREQQKKSEKLYMDTKKKGVKFYDKKGSGRLKDGKKVYD